MPVRCISRGGGWFLHGDRSESLTLWKETCLDSLAGWINGKQINTENKMIMLISVPEENTEGIRQNADSDALELTPPLGASHPRCIVQERPASRSCHRREARHSQSVPRSAFEPGLRVSDRTRDEGTCWLGTEGDLPFLTHPGAHHTGYSRTKAHLGPSHHQAAPQSLQEGSHQRSARIGCYHWSSW